MAKAVLLNPNGSEVSLNCHREGNSIFVNIPEIAAWDIAFILAE